MTRAARPHLHQPSATVQKIPTLEWQQLICMESAQKPTQELQVQLLKFLSGFLCTFHTDQLLPLQCWDLLHRC